MHHWGGDEADKRFEFRLEHGALHVVSVGIGTVEHNQLYFLASAHASMTNIKELMYV